MADRDGPVPPTSPAAPRAGVTPSPQVAGGSVSRRRAVLGAAGVVGTSALVSACGSGSDSGSGSAPTTTGGAAPTQGGPLARTADIPVGGGRVFPDQKVVVTQPTAGEFKAFSAVCTHAGCTVADVSEGTINCPCHGSKFAIADGAVKHGPARKPLPGKSVTVQGDGVTVA